MFALGVALPAAPAIAQTPPSFTYDPSFPATLPHHWILNIVKGLTVDKHDNVWIVQQSTGGNTDNYAAERNPPTADCCVHAPAVMAFNPKGEIIAAWGGPGYVPGWPLLEHTIVVDNEDHVWIGGNAAGDTLLEFTKDGKLIRDWGHRGPRFKGRAVAMKQDNQETDLLLRGTSSIAFDEKQHEVFIADGYLNKRVMVYDLDTGAFKRGWGAYGKPLSEIGNEWAPARKPNEGPRKDFTPAVHCVVISNEGLLYVCDRNGNRIQVFTKAGKYLREYIIKPATLGIGTTAGLAFSSDANQTWMYVADIENATVWIVNRKTGDIVGHIGRRGVEGGNFMEPHVMAADSKGNLYVGEAGRYARVQKFRVGK